MHGILFNGKGIIKAEPRKRRSLFTRWDYYVLALLVGVTLQRCIMTAGDPYRLAIQKQTMAQNARFDTHFDTSVIIEDDEENTYGFNLEVRIPTATDLEHGGPMHAEPVTLGTVGNAVNNNSLISGDEDTTKTDQEQEEIELPSEWQPDFWGGFLLVITLSCGSLWWLVQRWSIRIFTVMSTSLVTQLSEAEFLYLEPREHRGSPELVRLDKTQEKNEFFFQKQRWEQSLDPTNVEFTLVKPQIRKPISEFFNTMGVSSGNEAHKLLKYYGRNKFEIPLPSFLSMYQQHIIAPFFVFQIFTNMLWLLEEYWQYSLYSIGMLFLFEATVVFTRRMSIVKLRGMGAKASSAYVFRGNQWILIDTEACVPGDLIRLDVSASEEYIIPCDILLINGSAVVSEASLTGESVPLMKDPISTTNMKTAGDQLDIKGKHRLNVLFGGTQLMETLEPRNSNRAYKENPALMGCIGIVLRTGFSSSQGKLVRKLEFSTEKVISSSKDVYYLLGFLLIFAIGSSIYVYNKLSADPEKSNYYILIRCITIITSVVPPELPMQLAFSINSSMSTLMGLKVFCTEPHRIPLAGSIHVCCFDKTGTITTDKLSLTGIVAPPTDLSIDMRAKTTQQGQKHTLIAGKNESSNHAVFRLLPCKDSSFETQLILAGCHALVNVKKQILGDPIETAALESLQWKYANDICKPSKKFLKNCKTLFPDFTPETQLKLVRRNHFQSELQRMSVVANFTKTKDDVGMHYVLAKGSPEKIYELLDKSHLSYPKMEWYSQTYINLSSDGYRVLALAHKPLSGNLLSRLTTADREELETGLIFSAFVAFSCKNRADSKDIIYELMDSNHRCIMITGDSLLTAAHVGSEVGICKADKSKILQLSQLDNDKSGLQWTKLDLVTKVASFESKSIKVLSESYSLCLTGPVFEQVTKQTPAFLNYSEYISVYARMSPKDKETIIMSMKARGLNTLMCGDGTNDAGALKQADVGVALLSGYGNLNEEKGPAATAELDLSAQSNQLAAKLSDEADGFDIKQLTVAEQTDLLDPMHTLAQRERKLQLYKANQEIKVITERLKTEGKLFPSFLAKVEYVKLHQQRLMEQQRMQQQNQQNPTKAPGSEVAGPPADPFEDLQLGNDQMVKLGDASIAAPFTSKMPSIQSVLDIIRQGRSTLVTTIQMYQILVVNCLLSSYTLSALYLAGVKMGSKQMTASGILGTASFLAISRGKALPRISKHCPPASVFHPALFLSILGQFAILVASLMYMAAESSALMPTDYKMDPDGKFKPSLINTVIFLLTNIQHVCISAVNYKGRPYNQDITENYIFMVSLLMTLIGTFVVASEYLPWINSWLEFVRFPTEGLKMKLMYTLLANLVGTYAWDRFMIWCFLPKVYVESRLRPEDLKRILKFLAFTVGLLYLVTPKSSEDISRYEQMFDKAAAASTV